MSKQATAHQHAPCTAELDASSGYHPRKGYVYIYRLGCACGASRLVELPDHATGAETPAWMAEHGTPVRLAKEVG